MRTHHVVAFVTAGLLALPLAAWADRNPDFDDDAKPILRMQPGLLEYVEERFEVKDTGQARVPGNDDQAPQPPYMFKAKPRGTPGPYNLMLLIQPGPVNHILNVVDMTRVKLHPPTLNSAQPAVVAQPAPESPASVPTVGAQAPSPTPTTTPAASSAPTSDTPSGPIPATSANQTAPSLEPPPDPAPANH